MPLNTKTSRRTKPMRRVQRHMRSMTPWWKEGGTLAMIVSTAATGTVTGTATDTTVSISHSSIGGHDSFSTTYILMLFFSQIYITMY